MLRVVFMGSAPLACPALDALLREPAFQVVAAVTQPDRPSGRSLKLTGSPVREHLRGSALPVLTPENVNAPASMAELTALAPDVVAVVAYGQILRAPLLALAPLGCVNLHASLLPAYRGAAPIEWAIVRGERVTGVTTIAMNARMDAGDILLREEVAIGPDDTAGDLHERLAQVGAGLLAETLRRAQAGALTPCPQDAALVTFAPKLGKADGRLDWTRPAAELHNRVRGFHPRPGCFCEAPRASAHLLRVHASRIEPGRAGAEPGLVLTADAEGPLVQTGDGALRLLQVQPQDRRSMSGAEYLRGQRLAAGALFG